MRTSIFTRLLMLVCLLAAGMTVNVQGADPAREKLLNGTFRGVIQVRTVEGLFVAPSTTFPGWAGDHPDYQKESYDWTIAPSPRGGYFIYHNTGSTGHRFWQADLGDGSKLHLSDGSDDWESFRIEAHNDRYAFKNVANGRYLAAEPDSHGIHLISDREHKGPWESFAIRVVSSELPKPPAPLKKTGPAPFVCVYCGRTVGVCTGNLPGAECVFVSRPLGDWACPYCGQRYYSITHRHPYN